MGDPCVVTFCKPLFDTLNDMTDVPTTSPLARSEGVNASERYLTRLARRSFLSLWSYPGVYKDKCNVVRGGDGQEVSDLLVVFDNHIIIFSDKDCAFPNTGDLDLDWSRWYRKAIAKSAAQLWTAERWLRLNPNRLFLDRKCQEPFPIDLPPRETMQVHRIVVAHGASERCKKEHGGSGSLMIMPDIVGDEHSKPRSEGGVPFAVGQVDPAHGYYHVFDDATLAIVLNTLDTITDFVEYLEKKERFIADDKFCSAAGEEELLAYYLTNYDDNNEHGFPVWPGITSLSVAEGCWGDFVNGPKRKGQIEANKVSYFWDDLIETFLHHVYAGTSHFISHPGLANQERTFRLLARENRTKRRLLSERFLDWVSNTPSTHRARRVMLPSKPNDPYYVFLLLPHLNSIPYEEYREGRRGHLEECCRITKVEFPDAIDIIGIATEAGRKGYGSEDVVHLDARDWTPEEQTKAEQLRAALIQEGTIGEQRLGRTTIKEYPDVFAPLHPKREQRLNAVMKGRDRNKPCPCKSGKRWKDCCG